MFVNFIASSPTPITRMQVKVDGAVVKDSGDTGRADLGAFGSMRFTTPPTGRYRLSVVAVNAAGCSAEAVSAIPLVIR